MPKPASICFILGSSGLSVPSWKESGFLSNCRCRMPKAASPASYNPADSFARGSSVLEPTIPGGSVGAGVGVACPSVAIARPEHKNSDTVINLKATLRIRLIDSLLRLFAEHSFHDTDLGALAAIDLACKVEEFGVLPGASRIEQFLHHRQRALVMLDHSC